MLALFNREVQMKFIAVLLLFTTQSIKASSLSFLEEKIYLEFKSSLLNTKQEAVRPMATTNFEQGLFVDALWDLTEESPKAAKDILNFGTGPTFHFSLVERLRIELLKLKIANDHHIDASLLEELKNELTKPQVELRLIYIIAAHEALLEKAGQSDLIRLAKLHESYTDIDQETEAESEIRAEIVTDLYFNTPDTTTYMAGEYIKSVKIFMFCRQNRLYPCLMVLRDINGTNVRKQDGSLWTNPALASAVTGLPSYQRNGNTPAGIFTIDSVMPVADQQLSYGKFRRMMLNFIPKSKDEILLKSLLPESSWDNEWWKPTTVARDIGRNLFRIHGSGKLNTDPNTPFYPFMRTHGCISQRENIYDGIKYKDQRDLLDTIMIAMEMRPIYENEPKIKGILYIMELQDKSSPVTIEDLKEYGIQ